MTNITPIRPMKLFEGALKSVKSAECITQIEGWVRTFYEDALMDGREFEYMIETCKNFRNLYPDGTLPPKDKALREKWWTVHYLSHRALLRKNIYATKGR